MTGTILQQAHTLQEKITSHRRWLHAHPEVAFDLPETIKYVRQTLVSLGYQPVDCGKCGLFADITGNEGKTILLRADMDALPIQEEADSPFASQNGNMHACGHDLHTAMLLGAAELLKQNQSLLDGTVRLMFQPAEEILSGAKDMVDNGVLENVDAAMMIHVSSALPMETGTMIVAPSGVSAPAAAYFSVTVQGKGCHGAAPHKGVDALTIAAHILLALQEIHAREIPSVSGAVLTIGHLSGGTADNAIADSAQLRGTVRAFEDDTMSFLQDRITQISQGIAASFRGSADVTFDRNCPTLINDEKLCQTAHDFLKDQFSIIRVATLDRGGAGGSEDFAYVSHKVPSVMLSLAAGSPADGHTYPLHHPKVTFDEAALPIGAAALTEFAIHYLTYDK